MQRILPKDTTFTTRPRSTVGAAASGYVALLVVLAGTFMSTLDMFIVNVSLPSIQHDLGATPLQIQWVVVGYTVAIAALVILGSRLGDRFGARTAYGFGLLAFSLASAACGLAPTANILVLARCGQGIAAALMSPQTLVIIRNTFTGKLLARGFMFYGLIMGIAAVFGQLLGGALIAANLFGLGWRVCFLINVPLGVLALLALPRTVSGSRGPKLASMDGVGSVLLGVAVLGAMLALIQGPSQGWPPYTVGAGVASIIAGTYFTLYERHGVGTGRAALVDPRVFRPRAFRLALAGQALFSASLTGFFFFFALATQDALRLSAMQSGALFTAIGLGYLLTSSLSSVLEKWSHRGPIVLGAIVQAVGFTGVLITITDASLSSGGFALLAVALAISGAGMGLIIAPLATSVMTSAPAEQAATASGVFATVMQVAGSAGVALVGFALSHATGGADGASNAASALGILIVLCAGIVAVTSGRR